MLTHLPGRSPAPTPSAAGVCRAAAAWPSQAAPRFAAGRGQDLLLVTPGRGPPGGASAGRPARRDGGVQPDPGELCDGRVRRLVTLAAIRTCIAGKQGA